MMNGYGNGAGLYRSHGGKKNLTVYFLRFVYTFIQHGPWTRYGQGPADEGYP